MKRGENTLELAQSDIAKSTSLIRVDGISLVVQRSSPPYPQVLCYGDTITAVARLRR